MRGLERRAGVAALALLLILALEMAPNISRKSVTFDEPAHIGAGLSYLVKREFRLNLQHPPLVKEIAAVPLVLGGTRWPVPDRDWQDMGPQPDPLMQWTIGSQVLYENDHDRVVSLARWPCLLLTLLLGGMLFLWGRDILGAGAAIAGLALFVLDPNIVAHGYLVTTDAGFALFTVLFAWAAWRYMNHRTLKRLLYCALALGGAFAAKFTALALAPIFLILLLVAVRLLPALVPAQPSTIVDPFAGAPAGPRIVWSLYLVPVLAAAAGVVVWAIYFFKSPFLYVAGLKLVNADHDATYRPFMA
ncbi:MAG TPA: glycosyltransferase family 39 protein, partial [Candidatus Polarisedimenticolia bacterium]|nr:glycosyltransferase family 39 protein [Candidatus Polarisedimenticolia bacterium]